MKKPAALLMTLVLLLTALTAFAEEADDPIALTVGSHEFSRSELKSAATLYIFEAALSCAGYGYGLDTVDPLTVEDEMDKLVFDMERWYVAQDLAEEIDLYPLDMDGVIAAAADADETWERYLRIAWSENGMAFLPAGDYQPVEDDPNGNLIRYFASFGLTREALLRKAILEQTYAELKKEVTSSMTDLSDEEILNEFTDWFHEKMEEAYIAEHDDVIAQVIEELVRK